MELKNKKVLLVGLAKTGVSTIKYLDKLGAKTIVNDIKKEEQLQDIFKIYIRKVNWKKIQYAHFLSILLKMVKNTEYNIIT